MNLLQRILTFIDESSVMSRHKALDHWERVQAEGRAILKEMESRNVPKGQTLSSYQASDDHETEASAFS